jgi:hypothetical protein
LTNTSRSRRDLDEELSYRRLADVSDVATANNSKKHDTKASAADSSSDDDEAEIATRALAAPRKTQSRRGTTACEFCDKPGRKNGNCFFNPDNPANKLSAKMLERFLVAQGETPSARKDKLARTKSSKVELARNVVRTTEALAGVTSTVTTILPFLTAVKLRMCSIRGVHLCLDRLCHVSRVPLRSLTSPWRRRRRWGMSC